MRINSIIIEGYANVERIELTLSELNALVAFNNYGKSNVMKAIEFGTSFIKKSPSEKLTQMSYTQIIPINSVIANKPFMFEVNCTTTDMNGEECDISYSYSFEWLQTTQEPKIISEVLKTKKSTRYTTYIQRDIQKAYYLTAPTGRCDKSIAIENNNLVLNKIANLDDLFYLDIVNALRTLSIVSINTMQNPDSCFGAGARFVGHTAYSLDISNGVDTGFFIYSLMKLNPDMYELLKDAILTLLPTIVDIEPIEVDLKELSPIKDGVTPFSVPEKFYDIRVKESYNNQQTSINAISAGSKKIIYTLAMAVGANINQVPLIMFEELENSIHPALFQSLLMTFDVICPGTKIVISSHSPYLIKYLSADKIKVGIPNSKGLAIFKQIKPTKVKRALRLASEEGMSFGDYIFSLMYDATTGDDEPLNDLCV